MRSNKICGTDRCTTFDMIAPYKNKPNKYKPFALAQWGKKLCYNSFYVVYF